MKYTLIAEDEYDGSKSIREFNQDFLPDVLGEIQLFLSGVGFVFTGNLEFVEETFDNDFYGDGHDGMGSTLDDYPELNQKSNYYFDTERNK